MPSTFVQRDPFARTEIHRTAFRVSDQRCDWCGGVSQHHARAYLFVYRLESDGGTKTGFKGQFCSTGCFRAYHDVPTTRSKS